MTNPQKSKRTEKIITSALEVNERFAEYLTDQSDFLVVGVVGFEGVGKTTIVDLLAESGAFNSRFVSCFLEGLIVSSSKLHI